MPLCAGLLSSLHADSTLTAGGPRPQISGPCSRDAAGSPCPQRLSDDLFLHKFFDLLFAAAEFLKEFLRVGARQRSGLDLRQDVPVEEQPGRTEDQGREVAFALTDEGVLIRAPGARCGGRPPTSSGNTPIAARPAAMRGTAISRP